MTTGRFQRLRRIAGATQALVVLGLPFIRVGGESALRLDVPGGRLHALGASFAIDEAFVLLAATLVLISGFLLVTLLLGRVWCGWACPQTVLADLTRWVVPERRARLRPFRRPLGFAAVGAISAIVAANLLWYFVPPAEFFRRLLAGTLGPVLSGSWWALFAILFLDLAFLRATFCATACPYAKLQGVLFDRSTLVVAYDARRDTDCVDCGACVRVCPTGIDIRDGLQMECIACAECIDACTPVMAKLRRAPDLVGYFHGEPGRAARPVRAGVLALGAATVASLALLVGFVSARELLDLSAVPELGFAPRRTPEGAAVNAFSVALENHGRAPVTVALSLAAPGARASLRPESVPLAGGERRQVRVLASVQGLPAGRAQAVLGAEARRGAEVLARAEERIPFVVPGGGQ
ncbi:MAG TPA: 4Fe-4S dicluster domain-containing protein [Anaeromyxobacter sp.]